MSNLTPGPGQASPRRVSTRSAVAAGDLRSARLCRVARGIAGAAFDVPDEEIRRRTRSVAPICRARHTAMYLAHITFQLPMTAVAREFGRDRTSVSHAVQRIEDRRDDPDFERKLQRLETLAGWCLSLSGTAEGDEE